MRRKYVNLNRPYKVKHYIVVGTLAIILSSLMAILYVIPGTNCTFSFAELIIIILWCALGLAVYISCKKKYTTDTFSDIDRSVLK